MKSIITPLTLLIALIVACNQTTSPPLKEVSRGSFASQKIACRFMMPPDMACKAQLPRGFEPVKIKKDWDFVSGYFNDDNFTDYAMLAFKKNQDSETNETRIFIFEGTGKNGVRLSASSGNLGNIGHSPYKKLSVKSNIISYLEQQMRSQIVVKIRFQKNQQKYMIIGKEYENYGNGLMEGVIKKSINYLSGKSFVTETRLDEELEELIFLDPKEVPVPTTMLPIEKLDSQEGMYLDL